MPWGPHSVPYLCDHDTSQFFRYPTRNTNEITSVVNAELCAMIVLIVSNIFFCLFLGIVQATRLHAPKHNDHDRFRREAESVLFEGCIHIVDNGDGPIRMWHGSLTDEKYNAESGQ